MRNVFRGSKGTTADPVAAAQAAVEAAEAAGREEQASESEVNALLAREAAGDAVEREIVHFELLGARHRWQRARQQAKRLAEAARAAQVAAKPVRLAAWQAKHGPMMVQWFDEFEGLITRYREQVLPAFLQAQAAELTSASDPYPELQNAADPWEARRGYTRALFPQLGL